MPTRHPEHEIKGVWFIAGQSYLQAELPTDQYRALLQAVPEAYRSAVESPLPSMWYPEDAAASFLRAWLEVGARGDRRRFADMVAKGSEAGLGRFFRAFASVASPRFLLRRTPTIFKQLRRGPAKLTVEDRDTDVVVRYQDFPFLEDAVYVACFPAQLEVLARAASSTPVKSRVLDHDRTSMTVAIELL